MVRSTTITVPCFVRQRSLLVGLFDNDHCFFFFLVCSTTTTVRSFVCYKVINHLPQSLFQGNDHSNFGTTSFVVCMVVCHEAIHHAAYTHIHTSPVPPIRSYCTRHLAQATARSTLDLLSDNSNSNFYNSQVSHFCLTRYRICTQITLAFTTSLYIASVDLIKNVWRPVFSRHRDSHSIYSVSINF